jgi:hypothetical protein
MLGGEPQPDIRGLQQLVQTPVHAGKILTTSERTGIAHLRLVPRRGLLVEETRTTAIAPKKPIRHVVALR